VSVPIAASADGRGVTPDHGGAPRDARVFVAGHRGLVGSAIVRALSAAGFTRVLSASRAELDLQDHAAVDAYFARVRPEYVYLAAAKVGGILANATQPVEFLRSNLLVQQSVIDAAHRHDVRKLLFLGSSCIYPKFADQPIREEALLTGALEPTNEAYAIAKIAGIKLCQAYRREYGRTFISAMPTNLYGPGDNFDLASSHVLPALIRKFHEAKVAGAPAVTVWGTGRVRREFLHVDDMARACVFLMDVYDDERIINVGTGVDLTIAEAAEAVRRAVGYEGKVLFDATKPDGTPRKLLDVSRLRALGWSPAIAFEQGVADTYRWYVAHGPDAPRPDGAYASNGAGRAADGDGPSDPDETTPTRSHHGVVRSAP
jgi:GDP-L-fucose synthase